MAEPLHPQPNAPPPSVAHYFQGSQAAGKSDGIPLDAIDISFPFLWFSLPRSFSINLCLLPSLSKCYPVTCKGGKSSLPKPRLNKVGRKGRLHDRGRKGKEGWKKAERRRRGGCALAVESPVADRLVEPLSLSLPPTLAEH